MPDRIDIEEILRLNPHIDQKQLEEAIELRQKLRERGVRGAKYRLAPPFSGRRVSVRGVEGEDDPRTIHLRSRPR